MTISPHDAEEALRPYLGRVYDARADLEHTKAGTPAHAVALDDLATANERALTKALLLLEVPL